MPPADDSSHSPPRISTRRPAGERTLALPEGYADLLAAVKADVRRTQVRAALAANRELLALYWRIGRAIVARQAGRTWGSSVLERLAADLRESFPGLAGFSRANLFRMRAFHLAWAALPDIVAQPARQLSPGEGAAAGREFADAVPQPVASLPWHHNVVLVERVKERRERLWYADAAVANGWSRNVLEHQIATRLHERQGRAVTNFARTLPAPDSDLAQQLLKDPYLFDFLTLADDAAERDVERALTAHVERFLLELGAGFAFVGRQVRLVVDGEESVLDLLFYHLRLRCFVVVELKAGAFRPAYAGQLNFYLSAVDDLMRHPDDRPSIGLLLCRSRERTTVEYALRGLSQPIGVAEWAAKLTTSLPEDLRGSLPSVEELERELGAGAAGDAAGEAA